MSRTPARGVIVASGAVTVLATLCLVGVTAQSSRATEAAALGDSTLLPPSAANSGNQSASSGSSHGNWLSFQLGAPSGAGRAEDGWATATPLSSRTSTSGSGAEVLLPASVPTPPSSQSTSTAAASPTLQSSATPNSAPPNLPAATPSPAPAVRQQSRTSSLGAVSSDNPRDIARALAATDGWTGSQWICLDKLWEHESRYETTVRNPSSGAYGIPQALPASKMATAGSDWRTNPVTQIIWGLDYISDRYGTPCGAWSYWVRHSSY